MDSNARILDLVTKNQDGYKLTGRVSKEKFAQLCVVLGKHGYRYAGEGIFKQEISGENVYQDPKWWKQNVQIGDWVKLRVDFFSGFLISEVLQVDNHGIGINGAIEPELTITYRQIREVLEIRKPAEVSNEPLWKIPERPRRP